MKKLFDASCFMLEKMKDELEEQVQVLKSTIDRRDITILKLERREANLEHDNVMERLNTNVYLLEVEILKLKKKLANSMHRAVAEDFAKEMYHKGVAYANKLNAKNNKDKL